MNVDLYLGSDIGHWILDQVHPDDVRHVIAVDENLALKAQIKGFVATAGNANTLTLTPGDCVFSVHYPRILKPYVLANYRRAYNLHPGYLPWGRGYYPVFWALYEGTPAGATLHEMVSEVDQGPLVAQIQVPYTDEDTGSSLFERVRVAEYELFITYWRRICKGEQLPSRGMCHGLGTYHNKAEFEALKENTRWQDLSGEQLIHILRCLSFPGYSGLKVTIGARQFDLQLMPVRQS